MRKLLICHLLEKSCIPAMSRRFSKKKTFWELVGLNWRDTGNHRLRWAEWVPTALLCHWLLPLCPSWFHFLLLSEPRNQRPPPRVTELLKRPPSPGCPPEFFPDTRYKYASSHLCFAHLSEQLLFKIFLQARHLVIPATPQLISSLRRGEITRA